MVEENIIQSHVSATACGDLSSACRPSTNNNTAAYKEASEQQKQRKNKPQFSAHAENAIERQITVFGQQFNLRRFHL